MSTVWEVGYEGASDAELPSISDLQMRFVPLDLVAHWKRCGMVADFLSHFLGYNFENRTVACNIISTILNEALENAVKFSYDKTKTISLKLRHMGEMVEIEATNQGDRQRAERLRDFVQRLNSQDIEDLFVEQVEHAAEKDHSSSGLGLISLKKDYNARVGCRIESRDDGFF